MALNASDAVNSIYQKLNLIGQQIDQSDVFMYLGDAVDYFSSTYSFPTSKKSFDALFFQNVRQVGLPTDFGTLIEPKRYPALHSPRFTNTTSRELSTWPYGRKLAIEFEGVTPYLDVADTYDGLASLLSGCEATTGVTISGDGSGLSVDNMIYTEGLGSLRFTITGVTGQTVLSFALTSNLDITDWLTKNWCFLDLIAPSTNTVAISSIEFRLGSDTSNYYKMTATLRYRGDSILTGYGQVGFDMTAATVVGSPVLTATNTMQVLINHGTTGINGVYHLDNIFTAQGTQYQVPYYSKYNILAGGVTPTNVVTALTDVIMLPAQTEKAIIYKTLEFAAGSPNIANANYANFCARELKPMEDMLGALFPVERILVQSQWYKKTNFKRNSVNTNP